MKSRERLLISLNHREADRVPIDTSGIPSGTMPTAVLDHLKPGPGTPSRKGPPGPHAADPLIPRLDGDVKAVMLKSPQGFQARGTSPGWVKDEWGVLHPSLEHARVGMGEEEAPLGRATSTREIDHYPWPDPSDPSRYAGLKESARKFRRDGFGVVVDTPLKLIRLAAAMRGPEQFMADTALNRPLLEYLIDKILDVVLELSRRLLEELEEYADVVAFGAGLPAPCGAIYSPGLYRSLLQPRHRTVMRFLKEHAGEAKVLYASPGVAEPILPGLIELGVDAWRPLPGPSGGTEGARELKARYARGLAFWGGIDIDRVLSLGTPERIKAGVRDHLEVFAPGGGFVFAAARSGLWTEKPENISALYEAALEYGSYR